jgi:hypothetical protein
MNAPKVDVLAVMDAGVASRHAEWISMHDKYFGKITGIENDLDKLKAKYADALASRAAVAELIRASRRAERLLRDMADAGFGDPAQADELRAALANIGPQS